MILVWLQKLIQHKNRILFVLIVMLGLSHAMIYALVMPPWGLLDESQHFHYIQFLAEKHRLPVMWQDQLSTEIVDSFFETERYMTLGNEQMPDRSKVIVPGRLDAESYEAYQPPLYYVLLSGFYSLGNDDVLHKLFLLRFISVLVSSLTLIAVWWSTRILFPKYVWISIAATLFVALLPERAVSVSRINNDVLLEALCSLVFLVLANVIANKITWRSTVLMAIILVFAVLTKLSALIIVLIIMASWFWIGKRDFERLNENINHIFVIGAAVLMPTASLFTRNFVLYHDITGMNAFLARVGGDLAYGTVLERLINGTLDIFRNSWVILWKGEQVVTKPSATIMFVLLAMILLNILWVLIVEWLRKNRLLDPYIISISIATLIIIASSVMVIYVKGFIPTIQGRFLLPATVPTAWLLGVGLWLIRKKLRGLITAIFFATELTLGMSVLFFHLLPNYYAPRTGGFLGYWGQTIYLFGQQGMFRDKPEFVNFPLVACCLVVFVTTGISVLILAIIGYGFPFPFRKEQFEKMLLYMQEIREKIVPSHPFGGEALVEQKTVSSKRQISFLKSPLFWLGIFFFIFYLGWVHFYPPEIFWSLDEGGKFIHLKNIIETRDLLTSIAYPGRILDTNLIFVPLYFWSRIDDQIYSWWAIGFPALTIPFYLQFGWIGLYILPAGFGSLSAVLSGMIFQHLEPNRKFGSVMTAIIVGLVTPIAFYSTTFWEHTLSSGLFLAGILMVLLAWKRQQYIGLIMAGGLFSLATYFRTDTSILVVGIVVAFLVIRWSWAIIMSFAYLLFSVPWLYLNIMLTGSAFGRHEVLNTLTLKTSLFPAIKEVGWWFIPYFLFNAPKIGAFDIPNFILVVGTLATVLGVALSIFLKERQMLLLFVYAIVIAVSGWVLIQPQGYRSVHGFLLIAPHIIFAIGYFSRKKYFLESPLPLMVIGMMIMYTIAYILKGWVAAGGLQWGPRYLIIFYPLFTIASVIVLLDSYSSTIMRYLYLVFFSFAVIIGAGFQFRGLNAALQTRQYYEQTRIVIDELPTQIIVTDCPWISMVIPNIYFDKILFAVNSENRTQWVDFVHTNRINTFYYVKMDLCALTPLDRIKRDREMNPSGLSISYKNVPTEQGEK